MTETGIAIAADERQKRTAVWFAVLRDRICAAFEAAIGSGRAAAAARSR